MTLGNLLNFSEPQFSHLENGIISTFQGWLQNQITYIKHPVPRLKYIKPSANVRSSSHIHTMGDTWITNAQPPPSWVLPSQMPGLRQGDFKERCLLIGGRYRGKNDNIYLGRSVNGFKSTRVLGLDKDVAWCREGTYICIIPLTGAWNFHFHQLISVKHHTFLA